MTSRPNQLWFAVVAGTATVVFALAFVSPVEMVESDPAVALVASQALVEHHTLRLDVYRGHPDLAYDLDTDVRLRRSGGEARYFSVGVPVVFAPAVWLCNLFGLHMIDQPVEFAIQNLLSAALCAAIFVLFFVLCRRCLPRSESYIIAFVFIFASPVMSTLATALWNTGLQTIVLCLALVVLRGGLGGPQTVGAQLVLGGLVGCAFLLRPTTAFFGLAVLIFESRIQWKRRLAVVFMGLAGVVVVWFLPMSDGVRDYYSVGKLEHVTPLLTGLYGTLLSPSRGLFVFSPFLLVVVLLIVWHWRRVVSGPLCRVLVCWIGLHVLAVSIRRFWWGGHCFGPRLLTELIPGFLVLATLVWPTVPQRARRWTACLFLALALPAIVVHSGVGLWNEATKRWNVDPNVDQHHELLWSWRWPQILASDTAIDNRAAHRQRREQGIYRPGSALRFDSRDLVFGSWFVAEPGWRWSRGTAPWLEIRLGSVDLEQRFLLRMVAGGRGRQEVAVSINGWQAGTMVFDGFAPQTRTLVIPGAKLEPGAANRIQLSIPDAAPVEGDSRVLGVAFRALSLQAMTETNQGEQPGQPGLQSFSISRTRS